MFDYMSGVNMCGEEKNMWNGFLKLTNRLQPGKVKSHPNDIGLKQFLQ